MVLFIGPPPFRKQCFSDEHLLLTIVCFIRSQTGSIPTYNAKYWSSAAGGGLA